MANLSLSVLSQERVEDAFAAFVKTRENTSDSTLRPEFNLLVEQFHLEKNDITSWMDFVKQPSMRKRCVIGWLTMFGAQGTATLVINSKSPKHLQILYHFSIMSSTNRVVYRLWSISV